MSIQERFSSLRNGNDVRGVAIATDKEAVSFTPGAAMYIARAFVSFLAEKEEKDPEELRIGVGHDSRVTAEEFKAATLAGLTGTWAYDCGLASTPSMFQSTILAESHFDGAVMLTASHLPFNRSGMKFFTRDGGLEKEEMTAVLTRAAEMADGEPTDEAGLPDVEIPDNPSVQAFDLVDCYAAHMKAYIRREVSADDYDHPLAGLHIVVDAGNGAAGFFADKILADLGADVSGSVFLEPDGTFPNHVPNPENPEAMEAVRRATLDAGADLGVIFDCDGDRAAVCFADGTEVNRNALIALLSVIVAKDHPGTTIVTDSVTSDELSAFLGEIGMKHLRYQRGYKNVINKGIALNEAGEPCFLAIETSGHGAFKENYFSDDGAYISVRILMEMAHLKKEGRSIEELIASLTYPADEREVRFSIAGEDFQAYGDSVLADMEAFANKDPRFHIVTPNYEGIRVAFDDDEVKGWFLLRKSLHDPVMPMNVEAKEKGGVDIIMERLAPFFAAHKRLSR